MSDLVQTLRSERSQRLRDAMHAEGLDILVIAGNPWRSECLRYALDYTPTEGLALAVIERAGPSQLIVSTPTEAGRAKLESTADTNVHSDAPIEAVQAILAKHPKARIALGPAAAMPYGLAKGELGATVSVGTRLLDKLLLHKTPAEIAVMRKACKLADEGYKFFRQAARVGVREYELVARIEGYFRAQGCPENFMILGSGGQEVRGMHPPGEKKLAAKDLVTTELTPAIQGYYAQICRTLVLGPPSAAQQRGFEVYREALEAGIDAVKPGATAADVARAQNEVFRGHGLGEYVTSDYTRVRGHGLGLFADGQPSLLEDVNVKLEPDMTIIVHPNTYHPEIGYFVLGDAVRVTSTGHEVLCGTPRELFSEPI
jgi:Xaa-Pro dipeptidase